MEKSIRPGLSASRLFSKALALEHRRSFLRTLLGAFVALRCSSVHAGEKLPEAAITSADHGIPLTLAFAQMVEPYVAADDTSTKHVLVSMK